MDDYLHTEIRLRVEKREIVVVLAFCKYVLDYPKNSLSLAIFLVVYF